MPKQPKRARDTNQLAKRLGEIATSEGDDKGVVIEKTPAAVALGRLGGLKGGQSRAVRLSVFGSCLNGSPGHHLSHL